MQDQSPMELAQNSGRFQDNQLRLKLACNSLEAFAAREPRPREAGGEAADLAKFLETDLPSILAEQDATVRSVVMGRDASDQARSVSFSLMEEDRDRLLTLSRAVVEDLRRFRSRRGRTSLVSLRGHVARYLAAQRHYMAWSDRVMREHGYAGR